MSARARLAAAAIAIGGWALATGALALPRMTLTVGSRCSNCHVNPQGSGLRSDTGFYAMAQAGAWTWDKVGLPALHDVSDNQWRIGPATVTAGFDARLQMARLGSPHWSDDGKATVAPARAFIPMQLTPGVAVKLAEWLHAVGSVNVSSLPQVAGGRRYPGQSHFDAWLQARPGLSWPTLRAGMIQPTIGVRHDDHTILLRRNPLRPGQPTLPPYWNELGAEVSYEGQHLWSAEAGAFLARGLAQSDPGAVGDGDLITTARATLAPSFDDLGLNTWLGASWLRAGALSLYGAHLGVGKPYWGAIQADAVVTRAAGGRETLAWMVHASHPWQDWCVFEARFERATGSEAAAGKSSSAEITSIVAGVQFIPLPGIELRPEYRLMKTKEWTLGQWAAQFHLWF